MWTLSLSVRLSCSPVSMTQAEGWMKRGCQCFCAGWNLPLVLESISSAKKHSGQDQTRRPADPLWSTLPAGVKSFCTGGKLSYPHAALCFFLLHHSCSPYSLFHHCTCFHAFFLPFCCVTFSISFLPLFSPCSILFLSSSLLYHRFLSNPNHSSHIVSAQKYDRKRHLEPIKWSPWSWGGQQISWKDPNQQCVSLSISCKPTGLYWRCKYLKTGHKYIVFRKGSVIS